MRTRLAVTVLACLGVAGTATAGGSAAASATTEAERPSWPSLWGSGLVTLQDTATLPPKQVFAGIALENRDRDPFKMDVLDLSVVWTWGLGRNLETYGNVVVSRAVSLGDRPLTFPPPIDLLLPEGAAVPGRPYYALYPGFPYVNGTGTSQLYKLTPGDVVLGAKLRLLDPRGARPGLAVSGQVKIPESRSLEKLQTAAGTGSFDETLGLIAEWGSGRRSLVASVAATRVGPTPFGDRIIVFGPGGATPTDVPFRLGNRLRLGLGLRQVVKPSLSVVAEIRRDVRFGARTDVLTAPGPCDVILGAQTRRSRFHFSMGIRMHVNSVAAVTAYPSPLGGLADLSNVSASDLATYLTAIGAGAAVPDLRNRSQIALLVPPGGPPLPPGARLLPDDFVFHSHGLFSFVFNLGWDFGGPGH